LVPSLSNHRAFEGFARARSIDQGKFYSLSVLTLL